MFALKIHADNNSASGLSSGAFGKEDQIFVRDGLVITATAHPPYGFCHEFNDLLVLGEAVVPPDARRVEHLARQLSREGAESRALGENILLGVCINTREKSAVVASNIACCRPFFYSHNDEAFFCSTSIRTLAALGLELTPDEDAFPEFLVYRYAVPPRTLYSRVKRLIGGQLLCINLLTGSFSKDRHFEFLLGGAHAPQESTAEDRLRRILLSSLERPLQHYSNPAILLSGGLDSSLLASAAKSIRPDIHSASSSFSFAVEDDSEPDYALTAAKHLGMSHHNHASTAERYLSGLVEGIYFAEEPIHHLQSVMLYLLYKDYARGRDDVLISGEGADGLFGNDLHGHIHKHGRLLSTVTQLRISGLFRTVVNALHIQDYRWRLLATDCSQQADSNYHILWTLGQYSNPALVKEFFGWNRETILKSHRELLKPYEGAPLLDQTTILSLLCEGAISMQVWSKLADSQGLVVHYPFVSPRLIDCVTELRWEDKLKEPKYFIRSLLRNFGVPEDFIVRPKLSFAFPCEYWALPGSLFQPIVDMAEEMFERSVLRSLQSKDTGRAMLLWNLLNLYLWRKLLIEKVPPGTLSEEIIARHRHLV